MTRYRSSQKPVPVFYSSQIQTHHHCLIGIQMPTSRLYPPPSPPHTSLLIKQLMHAGCMLKKMHANILKKSMLYSLYQIPTGWLAASIFVNYVMALIWKSHTIGILFSTGDNALHQVTHGITGPIHRSEQVLCEHAQPSLDKELNG